MSNNTTAADKDGDISVSHKDQSRDKVGVTAFAVCKMRAIETEGRKMIVDPYAKALFSDSDTLDSFLKMMPSLDNLLNGCVARTKMIDDVMLSALTPCEGRTPFEQVVVLGAGLDTRPWRLGLGTITPSISGAEGSDVLFPDVAFFEVDFPEIFAYKLPRLKEAGVNKSLFKSYASVECDLSIPNWFQALLRAGFDVEKNSFFLLEGLTGYLTETECYNLFADITSLTSSTTKDQGKRGRIVATFLTPQSKTLSNMHRFTPENPLHFVTSNFPCWHGDSTEVEKVAADLGMPITDGHFKGYCLVDVSRDDKSV